MTTVGYRVHRDSTTSKISMISPKNLVFEVLTNLACPDRSETIRNGFPVKFRIDIGRWRLQKHFFNEKSLKFMQKYPVPALGAPAPLDQLQ